MILTASGTTVSMNILLFVVLIVFSTAQENYGLQNKQEKDKTNSNISSVNGTTLVRNKRYVTHMNSLLRNFNFFNNDGMHLFFIHTANYYRSITYKLKILSVN